MFFNATFYQSLIIAPPACKRVSIAVSCQLLYLHESELFIPFFYLNNISLQNAEFSFLLKERVCALVIKLFSPNIKYRSTLPSNVQQATPFEKPYFPISMRLLRVVSILIQKYHSLLVTECEIFLSLIVKFLDPDKPTWQRSLALEVLHKMTVQPELLNSFCKCYDLNKHTTSIFQDIVNSLGAYVQSLFVSPQLQLNNTSQYYIFFNV